MRWPEMIGTDPGRIQAWVQNVDLAPTLADAAGARLGPFPTGQRGPDGISVLRTLTTRGAWIPARTSLFEEHRHPRWRNLDWYSLRTTDQHPRGLWQYVEWASGERELYDLAVDPWRLHNLARARPELRRAFHAELDALRDRYGAG
jgi:arylsulfatase A-like enzyme